jgi:hypothetical protein
VHWLLESRQGQSLGEYGDRGKAPSI